MQCNQKEHVDHYQSQASYHFQQTLLQSEFEQEQHRNEFQEACFHFFNNSKLASLESSWGVNPVWTRQIFLINGPVEDRFDTSHSNVNNSRITKDRKSIFDPREAEFSDKKSKLFVIVFATLIFN